MAGFGRRRQLLGLTAAWCVAATGAASPVVPAPADAADDAFDLVALSPSAPLLSGTPPARATLVAFVSTRLPQSVLFHGVLHALNARLARAGFARAAYVDLAEPGAGRLARAFGVKSTPHLAFFAPGSPSPVPVAYHLNRTAGSYADEVLTLLARAERLSELLPRAAALFDAADVGELLALAAREGEARVAPGGGGGGAAAAAAVGADGGAAAAPPAPSAPPAAAPGAPGGPYDGPPPSRLEALAARVEAQAARAAALARRLAAAGALARELAARGAGAAAAPYNHQRAAILLTPGELLGGEDVLLRLETISTLADVLEGVMADAGGAA